MKFEFTKLLQIMDGRNRVDEEYESSRFECALGLELDATLTDFGFWQNRKEKGR